MKELNDFCKILLTAKQERAVVIENGFDDTKVTLKSDELQSATGTAL